MSGTSASWPEVDEQALGEARFKVVGQPSSQFLMRIFGLFAQQDLLPEHATVRNLHGGLIVRMKTALISRRRAGLIAEKMGSLVDTHQVEFFWKATPG